MNQTSMSVVRGPVVEEEVHLTLLELCRASNAEEEHVVTWVLEGVLEPIGDSPGDWRFKGESLRRARLAQRLAQDLEINPPGVALALELLDQIAALRRRLQRAGLT
jgi:chaperone modulatory protein CbpM